MPTPQEALAALLGGGTRRVRPTEDYGFSGAVPTQGELESPFEREQAARAAEADARDRAATDAITARNAEINDYNRPEVTQIRNDAFARSLLPARIQAEAKVEAARQATIAQSQRDERLHGNRAALQDDQQAAMLGRQKVQQSANARSVGMRQQLAAMQRSKDPVHVPGATSGFLGFGGNQKELDQAEIARLLKAIEAEDAGTDVGDVQSAVAAPTVDPARLARLRSMIGR